MKTARDLFRVFHARVSLLPSKPLTPSSNIVRRSLPADTEEVARLFRGLHATGGEPVAWSEQEVPYVLLPLFYHMAGIRQNTSCVHFCNGAGKVFLLQLFNLICPKHKWHVRISTTRDSRFDWCRFTADRKAPISGVVDAILVTATGEPLVIAELKPEGGGITRYLPRYSCCTYAQGCALWVSLSMHQHLHCSL